MLNNIKLLRNSHWLLLLVTYTILTIGILNLYSLQVSQGGSFYIMQSFWVVLSTFVFIGVATIDYRLLFESSIILYIINILLLFAVFLFGETRNFSTRWLNFGFFLYQPSESIKLVLALVLASYFAKNHEEQLGFKKLAYPFFLTFLPALLIKIQPDLGSAVILFIEFGVILFFVKIKRSVWLTVIFLFIVLIPITWSFILNDYHKKRFDAFLNPEKFAKTTAYQTIQAKFAIGSGKTFGKGFKKGPISKGKFVPEQETDFAFSVLAEEFGFLGSMLLISLYIIFLYLLISILKYAFDPFGFYLGIIIISYFSFQILMNLLMVTGLFPVIGVPLPFFSYGGTNLLISMSSLGILMSLYIRRYFFDYNSESL
jgi:rod shape determining protein RodA